MKVVGFVASALVGFVAVSKMHTGLRQISVGGRTVSERGINVDRVEYVPLEDVAAFTKTRLEFDEMSAIADLWSTPNGRELVTNGNFESGPSIELTMETPTNIPGWVQADGAAVMRLTGQTTGFIDARRLGRQGRQFFSGGKGNAPSITQTIDLRSFAPQLSGGDVTAVLQADLGGFQDQVDRAVLNLTWLDGSGKVLSDVPLYGPDRILRDSTSRFFRRYLRTKVPASAATAKIQIVAIGDRKFGPWLDGWADNISLKLDLPSR